MAAWSTGHMLSPYFKKNVLYSQDSVFFRDCILSCILLGKLVESVYINEVWKPI